MEAARRYQYFSQFYQSPAEMIYAYSFLAASIASPRQIEEAKLPRYRTISFIKAISKLADVP